MPLPESLSFSSRQVGDRAYSVPAGPSILEKMWVVLLEETRILREIIRKAPDDNEYSADLQRERCMGMAEMIAILLNPYDPNVDEVRREAMRRLRDAE